MTLSDVVLFVVIGATFTVLLALFLVILASSLRRESPPQSRQNRARPQDKTELHSSHLPARAWRVRG